MPLLTPGARRRRRWPLWIALALLLLGGAAAIAYFTFIKEPEDVSRPEVEFTAPTEPEPEPPPKKTFGVGFVWPYYGYTPGRTRYLPGVRLRPPFRRIWSRGGSKLIEFQPVMGKGRLFFQKNNGEVYSISAKTGRVHWRRRLGGLSASAPAWRNGRLFIVENRGGAGGIAGAGPAKLIALRASSGKRQWAKKLASASESSPMVIEKRVIVGSQDGTVYGMDSRTGKIRWRYRAGGPVKAAPTYYKGRVYFGDYAGQMTALRARDGKLIWRAGTSGRSFGRAGNFYSTPAVAYGRVYAGNTDGRVYSFAASSGRLAWTRSLGSYVYAAPAVAKIKGLAPAVFIGDYAGGFYALAAQSGRVLWRHQGGAKISGAASVIGNIVYYSSLSARNTVGLSARTGREVWRFNRGGFNPAISDGKRLFVTGYASVYAFEPRRARRRSERQARRSRRARERSRARSR